MWRLSCASEHDLIWLGFSRCAISVSCDGALRVSDAGKRLRPSGTNRNARAETTFSGAGCKCRQLGCLARAGAVTRELGLFVL